MGEKVKQKEVNKLKFSISLVCDDIDRTSGAIEVETTESLKTVTQKIRDAFTVFNVGGAEKYDIFGFGFDEFVEFLQKTYGVWTINEFKFDNEFDFYG